VCAVGHVQGCTTDNACPTGSKCISGQCAATCSANTDCGSNQVCTNGACKPKPASSSFQVDIDAYVGDNCDDSVVPVDDTTSPNKHCVKILTVGTFSYYGQVICDSKESTSSYNLYVSTKPDCSAPEFSIKGESGKCGTVVGDAPMSATVYCDNTSPNFHSAASTVTTFVAVLVTLIAALL
jgi:hypothetical protein